eukprot:TRINITY_DN11303_c0_g1_i1.p1 TRINITY_DN11303_c0_g1~~TRINITY_DN11303_c0_g1_i1.p1  ORF type:complete len:647 (-),score=85.91 TRINITY_DN11303_c0_g1_i1:46-1986(-)
MNWLLALSFTFLCCSYGYMHDPSFEIGHDQPWWKEGTYWFLRTNTLANSLATISPKSFGGESLNQYTICDSTCGFNAHTGSQYVWLGTSNQKDSVETVSQVTYLDFRYPILEFYMKTNLDPSLVNDYLEVKIDKLLVANFSLSNGLSSGDTPWIRYAFNCSDLLEKTYFTLTFRCVSPAYNNTTTKIDSIFLIDDVDWVGPALPYPNVTFTPKIVNYSSIDAGNVDYTTPVAAIVPTAVVIGAIGYYGFYTQRKKPLPTPVYWLNVVGFSLSVIGGGLSTYAVIDLQQYLVGLNEIQNDFLQSQSNTFVEDAQFNFGSFFPRGSWHKVKPKFEYGYNSEFTNYYGTVLWPLGESIRDPNGDYFIDLSSIISSKTTNDILRASLYLDIASFIVFIITILLVNFASLVLKKELPEKAEKFFLVLDVLTFLLSLGLLAGVIGKANLRPIEPYYGGTILSIPTYEDIAEAGSGKAAANRSRAYEIIGTDYLVPDEQKNWYMRFNFEQEYCGQANADIGLLFDESSYYFQWGVLQGYLARAEKPQHIGNGTSFFPEKDIFSVCPYEKIKFNPPCMTFVCDGSIFVMNGSKSENKALEGYILENVYNGLSFDIPLTVLELIGLVISISIFVWESRRPKVEQSIEIPYKNSEG